MKHPAEHQELPGLGPEQVRMVAKHLDLVGMGLGRCLLARPDGDSGRLARHQVHGMLPHEDRTLGLADAGAIAAVGDGVVVIEVGEQRDAVRSGAPRYQKRLYSRVWNPSR